METPFVATISATISDNDGDVRHIKKHMINICVRYMNKERENFLLFLFLTKLVNKETKYSIIHTNSYTQQVAMNMEL